MSTFEQTDVEGRSRLSRWATVVFVGFLLLAVSACGRASGTGQGELLERDKALDVGTTGVLHAVITTESSDLPGSLVQDVYIDADRNLSFSQEFGPDGVLERLVVIDGQKYQEYLAGSDWLIERNYQSVGEGALNEISDAVFGYKEAIADNELTSVSNVVIDGTPAVQMTYTRENRDLGMVEFVATLDATTLFPIKAVVRTTGLTGRDLAEISYDVDTVASMPKPPEMPTTLQTGLEAYSELTTQDLAAFGEFTTYLPTSALLNDYAPEIIHHEVASSEDRSSLVSVYYWPEDRNQRKLAIPDIQVTALSADSVDATYLETRGTPVTLSDGTNAVEVRDGDSLLNVTWNTEDGTRVSVFGNLQVFSEGQIREIAGSLKQAP